MNFEMKKNILASMALLTVITAFFIFACNKTEYNEPSSNDSLTDIDLKKLESIEEFEKLMQKGAKVNNEGLEYVFEKLQKVESVKDFMPVAKSSIVDFVKTNSFFKSDVELSIKTTETIFESFIEIYGCKSCNNRLWFEKDEELLSDGQKKWLNRINYVIDKYDDVNKMIIDLNCISKDVLKEGCPNEQYVVIVAVEIAKASAGYWYEKHLNWANLRHSHFSKSKIEVTKSEKNDWFLDNLIKADVKGAIAGWLCGHPGAGVTSVTGGVSGAVAVFVQEL